MKWMSKNGWSLRSIIQPTQTDTLLIYQEYFSLINAYLKINGILNKQNMRNWGNERLMKQNKTVFNSAGVIMWWKIWEKCVLGHYFVKHDIVIRAAYRTMLIKYAFPRFVSLTEDFIFKEDSTAIHYSNIVKAYLNKTHHNRWIEKVNRYCGRYALRFETLRLHFMGSYQS